MDRARTRQWRAPAPTSSSAGRSPSRSSTILSEGPTPVHEAIARCEQLHEASRDEPRARALIITPLAALHAMAGNFEEARDTRASQPVFGPVDTMPAAIGQGPVALMKELGGDLAGAVAAQKAKWLFFGGERPGARRSCDRRRDGDRPDSAAITAAGTRPKSGSAISAASRKRVKTGRSARRRGAARGSPGQLR